MTPALETQKTLLAYWVHSRRELSIEERQALECNACLISFTSFEIILQPEDGSGHTVVVVARDPTDYAQQQIGAPMRSHVLTTLERSLYRTLRPVFAKVAAETGLCEYLLAAICWRGCCFGRWLDDHGLGDQGHGHGLMQIDDRRHGAWLAVSAWRDPIVNIRKGAEVYQTAWNWLASHPHPWERPEELRHAALAAYNSKEERVYAQVLAGHDPDEVTTERDYARWVELAIPILSEAAKQFPS